MLIDIKQKNDLNTLREALGLSIKRKLRKMDESKTKLASLLCVKTSTINKLLAHPNNVESFSIHRLLSYSMILGVKVKVILDYPEKRRKQAND